MKVGLHRVLTAIIVLKIQLKMRLLVQLYSDRSHHRIGRIEACMPLYVLCDGVPDQ